MDGEYSAKSAYSMQFLVNRVWSVKTEARSGSSYGFSCKTKIGLRTCFRDVGCLMIWSASFVIRCWRRLHTSRLNGHSLSRCGSHSVVRIRSSLQRRCVQFSEGLVAEGSHLQCLSLAWDVVWNIWKDRNKRTFKGMLSTYSLWSVRHVVFGWVRGCRWQPQCCSCTPPIANALSSSSYTHIYFQLFH